MHRKGIGYRWVGYDFSKSAVEFAKKVHQACIFYHDDLYDIENKENFDLIFCTEVLEHLLYPERVLRNIYNLLNDQGVLFITVPNGRFDSYRGHINFWSKESFAIFLHSALSEKKDIFFFTLQGGRKLGVILFK